MAGHAGAYAHSIAHKHLRVLDAGLVKRHREGREVRYQVQLERLREAKAYLDTVEAQWEDLLSRLAGLVEK